jgi:hypothetical protein
MVESGISNGGYPIEIRKNTSCSVDDGVIVETIQFFGFDLNVRDGIAVISTHVKCHWFSVYKDIAVSVTFAGGYRHQNHHGERN